jgi:arylsulfatase A-like enzyme
LLRQQLIRTPKIGALARKSVVFENAYLGSYPCMPARRDMWTGRFEFPWRGWGPLEPSDPDIAKIVTQNGQTSMVISDHYHMWERGSGNYFFNFSGVEFIRGQENDLWITDPDIPIEFPGDPERMARHPRRPGSFAIQTTLLTSVSSKIILPRRSFEKHRLGRSNRTQRISSSCWKFRSHEPFDPVSLTAKAIISYNGRRFI